MCHLYISTGSHQGKSKGDKIMARVLISMPEKFLNEIDTVAEGENRTRSELIREALRSYMYKNQVRNTQKAATNAELLESLLG
jgi:metal-responsive CopG/Arc/MetJ family transcriptional regulator